METAKSGSHTIWDCKYHIVWVTKYRYPVLVGDVGLRARELLREISRSHEMSIHAGAINRDHVHLLLSIPPHLSVSRAVQYLKGKSSHKLLTEYQSLRKRYWASICGRVDIGWQPVEMLPMKSGRSTSKIKNRKSRTTISRLFN
jgi:REP-associated tyrosine transposase